MQKSTSLKATASFSSDALEDRARNGRAANRYAGKILREGAGRHGLKVAKDAGQGIKDAAQGIMATYKSRALGGIGHLGALSFHETKNVTSGEGGALPVSAPRSPPVVDRARAAGSGVRRRQTRRRARLCRLKPVVGPAS